MITIRDFTRRLGHWLAGCWRPPPPRIISVGGPRCLFFDDDRAAEKIVRLVLEDDGWSVASVTDETELEFRLATWHPDLVLLDIMLSTRVHLAGLSVARRVHQHYPLLPIVLSSSLVLAADVVANGGAVGFIQKPIETSTFSADLRRFLPTAPT